MKFQAATIKDIARELNISTSTVSRALRDSHEIGAETKKLVLACAEKMNYRPNPIALSLKEKRSRSIGVIVCEIANPFFSQVINGIESFAYDKGYNVIITQSRESYDRELIDMKYLASRSVDGILISLSAETNDLTHITSLQSRGMPFVLFDRVNEGINTHSVTADGYKGAYEGTRNLIKNGFKRIAAISGAESLSITKQRLGGYYDALKDNKIKTDESLVQHCFYGGLIIEEVEAALEYFFKLPNKPDAIITTSDKLTINCLKALKLRGISVPADIGLIGFSNADMADLFDPPLSIIRQPAETIGRQAAELLIQLIESKRPVKEFEQRSLVPEIQLRESSKKKR